MQNRVLAADNNIKPANVVRGIEPTAVALQGFEESRAKFGGAGPLANRKSADVDVAVADLDLGEMIVVGNPPKIPPKKSNAAVVGVMLLTLAAIYMVTR